jgi:hypothetical protein
MKTNMKNTTTAALLIPESLTGLKETARRVLADRERLAREKAAKKAADSWARLLAVARQTIPAELLLFTDLAQPEDFDGRTYCWWLEFLLPGHAAIRARLDRDSGGTWTRSTVQGRLLAPDAEGEEAWEVVGPDDRASAGTLGEALLLAEPLNDDDDGEGINLAALASDKDDLPF